MKKSINFINAFILMFFILNVMSCKETAVDSKDTVSALLRSGKWKLNNVTVDGVNKNDLFTGLEITFTTANYSSLNGDPVWPISGTWIFTDDNATAITRIDDLIVTIQSLTASNLTLALNWKKTTLGGGRINSISGNHVFELSH